MRSFRVLIIIISLLIHIILGLLLFFVVPPQSLKTPQPSYVELLDKSLPQAKPVKSDEKQFVRKATVPENDLTKKKQKARFASEDEQNVLEEQRARINDMTANRSSEGAKAAKQAVLEKTKPGQEGKSNVHNLNLSPTTPLQAAKERLLEGKSPTDVRVAGMKKQAEERESGSEAQPTMPSVGAQEKGLSTVGEMLPDDVKFGDFTALNTDRHLFYSFYARMEELIRYRWITYARAAVSTVTPQFLRQSGKENWQTKLEVILDPKGHFVRSILHESSGMKNLDDAPTQAFHDVGMFPNPPAEMVKDDGFIHIFYAFDVYMTPSDLANRR